MRVEAFAPNPGDLAALQAAPDGTVPGWDGVGTVIEGAANGSGPKKGERAVFLGMDGGWAQQRRVSTAMVAAADHDFSWDHLASLPVPATSALRALRRLGSVLGKRVLVVGAGSAVGVAAVQLAARSGAHVVAVARNERLHERLRSLGARETHVTVESVGGPVHNAIDMVGGKGLVTAYGLLGPGGTVIALGHAAGEPEHFPFGAFVADPSTADRSITSFFLGSEPDLDAELEYLGSRADLDLGPTETKPWTELARWIESGAPREQGRVVFRVEHRR
ncbi:zinc-binding dehydrogenase [Nocardiopsis sp. HNM0947]|uniref:Zinc-binding dehydrogenase n=1 Tax=Nocardiopsis coralli TaxID=2772213 RepID=A0ABR9P3X6_9ACTN|nr:zinc-binding dehydrogenase [Nocardiopsis coralli]MBE2998519.1 zinc-binding dehydrogenase [Nocardiopsis coralli]